MKLVGHRERTRKIRSSFNTCIPFSRGGKNPHLAYGAVGIVEKGRDCNWIVPYMCGILCFVVNESPAENLPWSWCCSKKHGLTPTVSSSFIWKSVISMLQHWQSAYAKENQTVINTRMWFLSYKHMLEVCCTNLSGAFTSAVLSNLTAGQEALVGSPFSTGNSCLH